MPDAALDSRLREVLPEDAFVSDVRAYAIEGHAPRLAIAPASADDVASVLRAADDAGAAVAPWSAGTQQSLGMPPSRYDVALDLRRLNRVIEYEPADLTVTVEAGIRLSDLQARLRERGQWLPLDPPLPDGATIGGILATNASGPSRYRYGTARDLLIGITFALPGGELVKSGGRVVKNVAGYDLGKLQIGALGTLGVITQATFKVAPLPSKSTVVGVHGPLPYLMSIEARLTNSLLAIQAIVITHARDDSDWRLVVQLAGGSAAVERSQRDFASFASDLEVSVGDTPSASAVPEGPVLARASVVPTTVMSVCEAFDAAGGAVLAYPTAGIVYGAWPSAGAPEALRELRRLCVEPGRGAMVLERAPLELKSDVGVWGEPRGDFELMRRLKAELDPRGILNPGRYVGGL